MFRKIIVGIDGGQGARDAIALAGHLTGPEGSVTLASVYHYGAHSDAGVSGGWDGPIRTKTLELLTAMAEEEAGAEHGFTLQVVGDTSPARGLQLEAERVGADLIVLGASQYSQKGQILLGRIARQVIHSAPCAVAIAPYGYASLNSKLSSIGVGYNGTPEADAALESAAEIARGAGATLHLLAAVESPASVSRAWVLFPDREELEATETRRARESLDAAIAGLPGSVETEIVVSEAAPALEQLSQSADLVVIGTRSWGSSDRIVLGSSAEHLINVARCPTIVVPVAQAPRLPQNPDHAMFRATNPTSQLT